MNIRQYAKMRDKVDVIDLSTFIFDYIAIIITYFVLKLQSLIDHFPFIID